MTEHSTLLSQETKSEGHRASLATKIFLGLVGGAIAGVLSNKFLIGGLTLATIQKYISDPLGKIFLNLLIMVVIPLVFSNLALGVAQIGDIKRLGRMSMQVFVYFVGVTAISVIIGLTLVNILRPGDYLASSTKEQLLASYAQQSTEIKGSSQQVEFGIQTLVNIVPRNPLAVLARPNPDMLALIFIALMVGVTLTMIRKERAQPVIALIEGINDIAVKIINIAMRLAPFGVAALIFSVTSRFGFDLLYALGMYVITVLAGLVIHFFGTFSLIVRFLIRMNPLRFFRRVQTVVLTAFSTSSSSATLPTSMAVSQQNLSIPPAICGFVLPLGATMNMNGTALFEGVTVLFLAQVFGVDLPLSSQILVVIMSVITAIGAAGVPSGSLPLLILILQMLKIPAEGIAIILGVDRLLDMCRTVLNVTGDITCAAFIARRETQQCGGNPEK